MPETIWKLTLDENNYYSWVMTGEKREERVKPCVLSEGVMYVSGSGITDLLQITDSDYWL